jgi:hypothetical protein
MAVVIRSALAWRCTLFKTIKVLLSCWMAAEHGEEAVRKRIVKGHYAQQG